MRRSFRNVRWWWRRTGTATRRTRRKDGRTGFEDTPTAYVNLLRPRKSYPLDPGKKNGGLELLSNLMPKRG